MDPLKKARFDGPALGAFVRSRRRELGKSQAELAASCCLSVSRIQAIELGAIAHLPRPQQLAGLATALEVGEDMLLTIVGYKPGGAHDASATGADTGGSRVVAAMGGIPR